MKSKLVKIFIAILVLAIIVCGIVFVSKLLKKDKSKENTYVQLVEELTQTEDEEMSVVSKAFLKYVSYDIKETNEDKQTADIEVSVPVLGDTYNTIVEQVVNENPNLAYEELLELTKEELADCKDSLKEFKRLAGEHLQCHNRCQRKKQQFKSNLEILKQRK